MPVPRSPDQLKALGHITGTRYYFGEMLAGVDNSGFVYTLNNLDKMLAGTADHWSFAACLLG